MSAPETRPRTRLLVTGAGGPAAVGFLTLVQRGDIEMWAADMDPMAAGLYLVPEERRLLLPRGDDPEYAGTLLDLCRRHGITVVVPTVDAELPSIAKIQHLFTYEGIRLLMAPKHTLVNSLDKMRLAELCQRAARVPRTELLTDETRPWFPSIVKPRSGSGSRGVRLVHTQDELGDLPRDGSYLIQEYLPGEEYSVDVLVRHDGIVVASVPRRRDKVDSGVAVAGCTLRDQELADAAASVARALGVRGVANVQIRRDEQGRPALLEVNPRLPGTLVLTAAAGANLAALALADLLGEEVPDRVEHREVAMVRYLTDVVVPIEEYAAPVQPASELAS